MTVDSWIEDLLREVNAAIAAKKVRLENPYVKDLIEVLMPHPRGLSRQLVLHTMERKRKQSGASIPENFEQSVQSVYNQHSVDSMVFVKRKAPESDGLFYSPEGKGSGLWAVNIDRATAWLKARLAGHA